MLGVTSYRCLSVVCSPRNEDICEFKPKRYHAVAKCLVCFVGKSVAQVSLRWLLQKDTVSSVVIGAKNVKQLEDNMGASSDWHMTSQQMAALDDASMYDVPYPYEMVWRINKERMRTNVK